ncbi:ferric reductase [Pyrenochaeta sp. MPI-SDFR-AT-0127]|nr:ferric reductase [Pyrenochaeta sp. MPI-SDFR-AT-0127]
MGTLAPAESLPSIYVPNIDDTHANASTLNRDPFKFSHGLTGVDQSANYQYVNALVATALVPAILAITFRICTGVRNDRRRISAITSCQKNGLWEKDRYQFWGWLKRYFLYSPICAKKHNSDERGVLSAVNVGTLPTLPQLAIIIIYIVSNIAYCLAIPEQPRTQRIAAFRGQCGAIAAFNMIFTALFALRNNPFIWVLHISYDTFNLFHRWMARLVMLQSGAHVFAFIYNTYQVTYNGEGGWHSIVWVIRHSLSYQWGLTAFVALGLLMVHSVSPLRHAFYETFLTVHRIGIMVAITGIYYHLAKHDLPQLPWVYLFITLLALETLARIVRISYYNFSWKRRTWTQVSLEKLPGEATRVTFSLPQSWNVNPGSHIHIYLPRLAIWSSHPFSIAWSQSSGCTTQVMEKLPSSIGDLKVDQGPSTITCVIRARTGMTRSLYKLVSKNDNVWLLSVVEGPYGGYRSFDSYGTIVLFAAGVGITHQLPFVRHLLAAHNSKVAAAQKIILIWCIKNTDAFQWVQPWLEETAEMQSFLEVVRIRIHISRTLTPESEELPLPAYLEVREGRCDPQEVVDEEIMAQVGAMAVSVCGPGGFSDSVRAAARRRMGFRSIDFFEEAFSY